MVQQIELDDLADLSELLNILEVPTITDAIVKIKELFSTLDYFIWDQEFDD